MTRSSPENLVLPSNRSFGRLFVIVFTLLALWSWWSGGSWWRIWLGLSVLVLAVTLFASSLLTPLNRLWMKFAAVLHRFVSPVMLGIVFFGVITPYACVMRMRGRDPLLRRFDPSSRSYWIERKPPGPDPKSLPNQF
jgi:hypothetical protein